MIQRHKKRPLRITKRASRAAVNFLTVMAVIGLATPTIYVSAADNETKVLINEIESDDPNGGNDWVEIINEGTEAVDISNWFVTDDAGLGRLTEGKTWGIREGTVLNPGSVLVLEDSIDFDFGLGKNDTVSLYDGESNLVDTYSYTGHATGTYSRAADGTFVDTEPTKGAVNKLPELGTTPEPGEQPEKSSGNLVINEVNSSPDDWVELMNIGTEVLDISGYEIRDNSDDHRWKFPEGTSISAGGILVVDAEDKGLIFNDQTSTYVEGTFEAAIGIGSGDSVRIYDKDGKLLDECIWSEHASYNGDAALASIGRYPDGTGAFCLTKETKGVANDWYKPDATINEVESNGDDIDWVEITNIGTQPIDISGWYLYDNDPVGHASDIIPVADGTILEPGQFYVFEQDKDFTFGLGKADKVTIYAKGGAIVDEYEWTAHAAGVYARIPDGTGVFRDFETSTKGKANIVTNPVVLNEIQSNDKNGGPDWVELANPTGDTLDISGIVIKDNDDKHEYTFPEGTTIPANGFFVVDELGFGLGKGDSVRLFENGMQIAGTTWPENTHTNPTWGLYPDVNGSGYRNTKEATPGAANVFAGIPSTIEWPGNGDVTVYDTESTFLEDSSGLDFFNGQLYAVDNGTGKFWIMDVAEDGTLSFAKGFENGKRILFKKDAGNTSAPGPDTEGITVDGDGFVYVAAERDNANKGVNYDTILKVDPNAQGNDLIALQEWNLTASLPPVSANMGIEAVEWVSNADVAGRLFDQNTNAVFDAANYPNAVANGVFFVALEDNGHVYAYVLNGDGSVVQIADIDSKIGGAMALDYDTYEKVLWVAADDGFGNLAAKIAFTGNSEPDITHVAPPSGLDASKNNEGFAIADASYTKNGQRPVYRFEDGVKSQALKIGFLACDYKEADGETETPGITTEDPAKDPAINSGSKNPENNPDINNTSVKNEGSARNPKTGDTANMNIYLLLSIASLMLLGAVVLKKSKH